MGPSFTHSLPSTLEATFSFIIIVSLKYLHLCSLFSKISTCNVLTARTVPNLSNLVATQYMFGESEFQLLGRGENNLIIEILNENSSLLFRLYLEKNKKS